MTNRIVPNRLNNWVWPTHDLGSLDVAQPKASNDLDPTQQGNLAKPPNLA